MPLIPFPNVPNVPGVPAIPRANTGANATTTALLGAVNGIIWAAAQNEQRWGIYDKNGKALGDPSGITGIKKISLNSLGLGSVQSTVSVEYGKAMRISDFPVERGSFASYNKVEAPANPAVSISFSGSEADRSKFLMAIDKATKSTDFYSVVTPEVQYVNYSIESYVVSRRADRGATLLIVDLTLKEIRQVSAQYTGGKTPKQPSAAQSETVGKVQALNPARAALQAVQNFFPSLVGG